MNRLSCIRAKEWVKFGNPVKQAMLGDILVFDRKNGGHVGHMWVKIAIIITYWRQPI